MMMMNNDSYGKQMAQYLHPYNPIPTIYKLPVQQSHQLNRKPEEWKDYMEHEISCAAPKPVDSMAVNISTFHKAKVIGFVPPALFDVKPHSYCPRILTIGPLHQNLEASPMDRCKALCVKKFMERHGISNVGELMNELIPDPHELSNIYSGLTPGYNFESLRLLVTVDTVFIHEFLLFLRQDFLASEDQKSGYLYTFINNGITISQMWRDLLLIGNQIPMSFLKRIINIPKELPDFTDAKLIKCLKYLVLVNDPFLVGRFNEWEEYQTQGKKGDVNLLDCEHLLDCLYVSCTQKESHEPSTEPQKSTNGSRSLQLTDILNKMYTACLPKTAKHSKSGTSSNQGCQKTNNHVGRLEPASELIKAGIRFKARGGNTSVIKYHKIKSRLDLPRLVVYDGTEDILRNLIAHEQTSKDWR